MVKFAHMADIHLGGWRHKELQDLNFQSFQKALNMCIDEKIDFLLIAGDLFDTAYPPIEILKETFAEFRRLKDSGIPCFIISGSHDYSVSGKTFLEVLEKGGFCKNVTDFDETEKGIILNPTIHNGVALYGFPGKKSGLDLKDLKKIKLKPSENKFKILMLHTTIDKAVESLGNLPIDFVEADSLPETDYCALGHIHIRLQYKQFVYPGPLFPNNFAELETLKHGSFCMIDTNNEKPVKTIEIPIKKIESVYVTITDGLTATDEIISKLKERDLQDKIILLRISGELKNSKQSDIQFKKIEDFAKQNNAYFLLRNTHELKTEEVEFESELKDSENIEDDAVKVYLEKSPSSLDNLALLVIKSLSIEKGEGETSESFSSRLIGETRKILEF
ncbi:MAG TPA: DNA repair exonuclease [Candidatus Nanoarchaeia archaeon]|nr:DNA repair exonuclease [Candidatus Nanoarchaeia archaeon]